MATMNISLPDSLEAYVQAKLESGGYGSASEVIREGLRLLQERDQERLRALKASIQEGLDAVTAGRTVPLDSISAETIAARARQRYGTSARNSKSRNREA